MIIGPAESLLPGASLDEYCDMMRGMAIRARVPVALHFDHGFTPELVEKSNSAGVHFCYVRLQYAALEENLCRTREMAAKAHAAGCSPGGQKSAT